MSKEQKYLVRKCRIFLLSLVSIALVIAMFVIRNRMERNFQTFHEIYLNLSKYQQAGQLLRQGSDLLTDYARRYAVTSDPAARNAYFHEATEGRHRNHGLEILETIPGGQTVKQNLEDAMEYSVELMSIEYHAMSLATPQEYLENPDCPVQLRNYPLTVDELYCAHEERLRRAQKLLFGQQYEFDKERIYQSIEQSFTQATSTLELQFNQVIASQKRFHLLVGLDMVALFFSVLTLILLLHRQKERANAFLRKILDNLPLLVFIKDAHSRRYLDANTAFLQFAGKKQLSDIRGKDDYAIFQEHTAKILSDNDTKAIISHTPITLHDTLADVDGKEHRYRITQFTLDDSNGNPCVFGMAADITASEENNANSDALTKLLLCLQKESAFNEPGHFLKIIRERIGADHAFLVHYDQKNGLCRIEGGVSADVDGTVFDQPIVCSSSDVTQFIQQTKRERYFAFGTDDLVMLRNAYMKYNGAVNLPECATMIAFSIYVHRELWGNLAIGYVVPKAMNNFEKEFCFRCCEILALAIERLLRSKQLQDDLDQAVAETASRRPTPDK